MCFRRILLGTKFALVLVMKDDRDQGLVSELRRIHGDDASPFTSRHHARYFEDDVVYHVLSKVIGGLALLVPSEEVNDVIAGVLGRVQQTYPQLQLYAHAFLSNHFHLALRGPGIPKFMGLLKQQISLRLKGVIDVWA